MKKSGTAVGEVIGGRYRLLSVLGSGGQGIVYRARDEHAEIDVAVKVLRAQFAEDPGFRERLYREARAMTLLTGKAAVRVLDQSETLTGGIALVMELLDGEELEARLGLLEARGERLPLADVLRIMAPVVDTLHAAHEHGIVHRDLKPSNIFLLRAGSPPVRVLDFGFARFLHLRALTAAGFVAGSPSYIAPESWQGKTVDHRADVYSLGAILFRMLGGRAPFWSKDLRELLRAVTTEERPSLCALRPEFPQAIDDWVNMALAVDRDARFLNVTGLWRALVDVLPRGARRSQATSSALQVPTTLE